VQVKQNNAVGFPLLPQATIHWKRKAVLTPVPGYLRTMLWQG